MIEEQRRITSLKDEVNLFIKRNCQAKKMIAYASLTKLRQGPVS